MRLTLSVTFLLSVIAIASACGFGSLGGCGGGCGCGRKKRSTEFPNFAELSGESGQLLCNDPELKKLIVKNLREDINASKVSVSQAVEVQGQRFVVICSRDPFVYAVRHETLLCAAGNSDHICHVFEI